MPINNENNERDLEATQIINMTSTTTISKIGLSEEELKEKINQPDWGNLKSSFSNLSVIGIGGMGTVFSAKDTLFYRNLALKIMRSGLRNDEESINAFLREARITAQIDHPNVVPVYNLGVFDSTGAYFSMKKVEGETLEYVLKKLAKNDEKYIKKYSLRHRLEIFINICNGVAFAHSKGVIHRDLKPANIMLGNYGEVFIMDWGMAVYIEKNDLSSKGKKIDLREEQVAEKKNVIKGTPLFLSPEQICGCEIEFGESSDVYALGNILYCLLCCTATVHDPTLETKVLLNKIVDGEIIRPRKRAKQLKISKELEAICLKSLEVDKEYRYSNAKELLGDIRNYLDLQVIGINNSPIMRFIKYCRRHPMIPSAVIAAILTITIFFSYFYIKDRVDFNSIMKLVELHNNDCTLLLQQQKRLLSIKSNQKFNNYQDYAQEQAINNDNIAINEAQFYDSALQELDALDRLKNLNYYPDISQKKIDCIKTILTYYINSSSSNNFRRIIDHIRDNWKTEFYTIITKNRDIKDKLRLLEADSGKLKLNSSTTHHIAVDFQNQDNLGEITEEIKMTLPFEKTLKQGTYIFTFRNRSNQKLSIPIKVTAGILKEYDLNVPDYIPDGMIYIPKGEYLTHILDRKDLGYIQNTEQFFIKQNEVTFGEYLEFWNSLDNENDKKKFTAYQIKSQNGLTIVPIWDENGVLIEPFQSDMPIRGLSTNAIERYCEYLSKKTGKKVRIPTFYELEKAARGIDKRMYVWGDDFDKNNALLNISDDYYKYPYGAVAGTFPKDKSVYGVNDLAGNLRELAKYENDKTYGVYGGSFLTDNLYARCSNIYRFTGNTNDIGFRYVMEINEDKK